MTRVFIFSPPPLSLSLSHIHTIDDILSFFLEGSHALRPNKRSLSHVDCIRFKKSYIWIIRDGVDINKASDLQLVRDTTASVIASSSGLASTKIPVTIIDADTSRGLKIPFPFPVPWSTNAIAIVRHV